MYKYFLVLFLTLSSFSTNAAVILESSLTGLNGQLTNVNWNNNGVSVEDPFTPRNSSGTLLTLFNNNSYFGVEHNFHFRGAWSTAIRVLVSNSVSSISLSNLVFQAFAISGNGNEQTFQRDLDFGLAVMSGSSTLYSETKIVFEGDNQLNGFDASKQLNFDLSGVTLLSGQEYTFIITASGSGAGNNAALNDFVLNGDITQKQNGTVTVTSPSTISILLLTVAFGALRRKYS